MVEEKKLKDEILQSIAMMRVSKDGELVFHRQPCIYKLSFYKSVIKRMQTKGVKRLLQGFLDREAARQDC